ncbi:2Fe-2S iron-sulfur cluster-binding protein [Pontibacterium granulatum]|uniref:2Fe-2S iron-sulfur cluster-binding protein n=1 Tax=Pontibacterium granulatum TaxID=2036029 RepID=UPI00249A9D9C|nr:2Fe-2S iron-sulfur cluster-binding protein [Pontibacterium granulatum]MDI3324380.1 2Fe-2S iron-sulfur cluster-binding protein [Pontibacterium granulatum]
MGHKFAEIAFTPVIREMQAEMGSRSFYAEMDRGQDYNHQLTAKESTFITARDSFYMASVTETGWPYIQHRGGEQGFVKVLDEGRIGFADYTGNRQYVSTGNFTHNNRVALFFMDYANRRRLKLLGRVQIVPLDDQHTLAQLVDESTAVQVERGFVIEVEAFDWNCPQHITPRFTAEQVESLVTPLKAENERLHAHYQADAELRLDHGELALEITGMRQLTPRIRSFELRDPNGHELPPFQAGAHLEVPVRLDNGEIGSRHYSISSDPNNLSRYEIAVLREDKGRGGSRALHRQYQLGMQLLSSLPKGHFTLHDDQRPAVLIAGGIGITPLKAMVHQLQARGAGFHLHYLGRSKQEMAFVEVLEQSIPDHVSLYPTDQGKRLDLEPLLRALPAESVVYVCGPARLIDAVNAMAEQLKIPSERIRFERFSAESSAEDKSFEVTLAQSGQVIKVPADKSPLDALLDAGVDMPYSCKSGNCRTCAVKVLDGDVIHRDAVLTDDERNTEQLFCPCVSRALGDTLTLDI